MALVPVIWSGPFPADLPERGTVNPGEQIEVTPEQAAESAWFRPVGAKSLPPKATAPKPEEPA